MSGIDVLSVAHAAECLVMLGAGRRKVSDFLAVTRNHYGNVKVLSVLEEAGLIVGVDVPRSRATWYELTDLGREVAALISEAGDLIDQGCVRYTYIRPGDITAHGRGAVGVES